MKNVYIVTTPDGFFAQKEMPWSSMDVEKIKEILVDNGFFVNIVTYDFLKDAINNIKDSVILYTSSQRTEHKRYIEDIVSFYHNDNLLIPSIESLKSHDNKGYQSLLNNKYNLGLIDCDYLCDIREFRADKIRFPLVFKPANGASATGVKIINDINNMGRSINDKWDLTLHDLKRLLKRYFFKSRYNKEWEDYISFGKQRFIVQKLLPKLKYDYKVLIFGNKYYALKRFTSEGDFRASGSGLHSRDFDNEIYKVLDKAKQFKDKYSSHIYSLDLCIFEEDVHIIEFQFTHVGPVTLSDSSFYYSYNNNSWDCIHKKSNLEEEFTISVIGYVNENTSFCS